MSFTATLTTSGRTAIIALTGTMDAAGTEEFRARIDKAVPLDLTELVLDMSELEQLTAAGIRAVTYARQQMSDDVTLVIGSASPRVRSTLRDADLDDSVAFRD